MANTPCADARTLVEIVWSLPGKPARAFRRTSATTVCRVLGGDVSLVDEIEWWCRALQATEVGRTAQDFLIGDGSVKVSRELPAELQLATPEQRTLFVASWIHERRLALIDREKTQQLALIKNGFDLLGSFGVADARDRIAFGDLVRRVVQPPAHDDGALIVARPMSEDDPSVATPLAQVAHRGPEISMHSVAAEMGVRIKAGTVFDREEGEGFVHHQICAENTYWKRDQDLMEEAIRTVTMLNRCDTTSADCRLCQCRAGRPGTPLPPLLLLQQLLLLDTTSMQHRPNICHDDTLCLRRTWRKTSGDDVVKNSSTYKAGLNEVIERAKQMARGATGREERAWAGRVKERVIAFDELSICNQRNLKASGRLEQTAASSSWTLAERAEAASYVLHFLRVWRSWLLRAERLTLKANFISRECYEDITISVHNVILIIRFFRDFTPGLPCALTQDGSDCCEKVFSELCGSGASSTMQRIYTHYDALRAVPKYWHVEEQMCSPDALLKKRRHEKLCDVWHKDVMPGDDIRADGPPAAADLSVYPSDAELTLQWTLGQQRAMRFAWNVGIRPPSLEHLLSPPPDFPTALPSAFAEADQWYIEPWAEEETALLHMRTADHDDQGHEAPMDTIPADPHRVEGHAPPWRSESDTDDDDGDEADHQHTLSAKALTGCQPSDVDLHDDPGMATHTFSVIEDDFGVAQEVIIGGASRDSDNARSELRAIVDTLITENISDAPSEGGPAMVTIKNDGGGGSAGSSTKICPHVMVPERGLVSIQQLVSELNHVKPGAKLSKDRLTRVTQGSSEAPSQRTVFQALELERRMLGLQGDFAMIFENGSEMRTSQQPYHFWLGKVQRLIKLAGRRRFDYREPVDLDSYEGKIVVVAHWYKAAQADASGPDVDSVYVLNEPDHQCYDIAHVLAPITLTSSLRAVQGADGTESFEYVLSKIDRYALDAAIAEIAKSEGLLGSTSGTSAKRKRSQTMADDGRETRTITSTRGRMITAVQYNA
ncbi:hypothetical protein JKP88DRAFT_327157 [Tribonema minus]|uniref:Uncharacterized protein n=1 Tax=Tribonema minus TaxID=303371 RepID=A0A836CBT4_9STRA|nr:hypothetical protein JKP88DRAFT_327157 [Tribonema minus]